MPSWTGIPLGLVLGPGGVYLVLALLCRSWTWWKDFYF